MATIFENETKEIDFAAPNMTAENPGFNKTIGGSTISAIVGANPWENAYQAWEKLTGRVKPEPENAAMKRGHTYEPIVADLYGASHPEYEVTNENPATGNIWFVRDRDYKFLTGQPDRMLHDRASGRIVKGLEIKTASATTMGSWGEEGTVEVPAHYYLQSLWYGGLIGGVDWALTVLFFRPAPMDEDREVPFLRRDYEIPFDKEIFETVREEAIRFWKQNVEADIAPDFSVSDKAADLIYYAKRKYPENVHPISEATIEEESVMNTLFDAKKKLEEAEKDFELCKAQMQILIGDRDGIKSDAIGKVTWKKSKDREVVDWKGVIDDLNLEIQKEVMAAHTTKRTGSRTFLATAKK